MHKRVQMAGGNLPYSASLQLTSALLVVFVVPLTLAVFYALYEFHTESVHVLEMGPALPASQGVRFT